MLVYEKDFSSCLDMDIATSFFKWQKSVTEYSTEVKYIYLKQVKENMCL